MNKKSIEHMQRDLVMADVIKRIGPMKLRPRRLPTFHSLTEAIIHQQLSGKAAMTILGRFQGLFGGPEFPAPEQVLRVSPKRLASVGLSGAKTSYILELARRAANGRLPSFEECKRLEDEDLIEQ